jgi:hypothetical protein
MAGVVRVAWLEGALGIEGVSEGGGRLLELFIGSRGWLVHGRDGAVFAWFKVDGGQGSSGLVPEMWLVQKQVWVHEHGARILLARVRARVWLGGLGGVMRPMVVDRVLDVVRRIRRAVLVLLAVGEELLLGLVDIIVITGGKIAL